MRINDVVRLNIQPLRLETDLPSHLLEQMRDKAVLNIGAAGGVTRYLPSHQDQWLHSHLAGVAKELVGVDLDHEGVEHAAKHGWSLIQANCETMKLGKKFDSALMIDVIEHVEAPARCILNVLEHLKEDGRLYITSPNPGYIGDILKTMLGRAPEVYWDHQMLLSPEHLQAICDRHGFQLKEIRLFSHLDQRGGHHWKSKVVEQLSRLNMRLHTSWLGVIEKPANA